MPRRVLTICGSLQAASANRAVLAVVTAYLRRVSQAGGDVYIEDFDELGEIIPFSPDHESEPGAAVTLLRRRLAAADTVVISSPEYAGGMPGALKNALDWIVGSAEFYAKPVVVISSGTTGGEHARRQLIQTLTWQGAHVVGELGVAAPRKKSDANGNLTDPVTVASIEELAQLALNAPDLPATDRLARVRDVLPRFGISHDHIAPVS